MRAPDRTTGRPPAPAVRTSAKVGAMPGFDYASATKNVERMIKAIRQRVFSAIEAPEAEVPAVDKLKLQNLYQLFTTLDNHPDKRGLLGLNELVLELISVTHEETVANMIKAGSDAASVDPTR